VPGTFDPITLGHLEIITRAAAMASEVVVAVAASQGKHPWFSAAERVAMVRSACASLPQVSVDTFDGLLVQYAVRQRAQALVKGLRSVADFEFELQMARANRILSPELETVFLAAGSENSYLSSSIVREVALFGGDLAAMVPPNVIEPLRRRAAERNSEAGHRNP
jgi:pantetheine-phosphate adenylyltransferase